MRNFLKRVGLFNNPLKTFRKEKRVSNIIPEEAKSQCTYVIQFTEDTSVMFKKLKRRANRESVLVVVENSAPEKVIGIITDWDILLWAEKCMADMVITSDERAPQIMEIANTKNFYKIFADDTIETSLQVMNTNNLAHIVVVNRDETFYGILSKRHLQGHLATILEDLS